MLFLWLAVAGVVVLFLVYLALRVVVSVTRWAVVTVPMVVVFGALLAAFVLGSR